MRTFYFRSLFAFLIFIATLNIILSIATFNPRQILNFAFYDTRVFSSGYLIKDIVVELGVNIRLTDNNELLMFVDEAVETYKIDRKLLLILIDPNLEYSISLTGGMGLTRINPYTFFNTPYTHPFIARENILAAAYTIKQFSDKGIHPIDIAREFLTNHLNYDTIRKASPYTTRLIMTMTDTYNKQLYDIDNRIENLDIFNMNKAVETEAAKRK